VHQKDLTAKTIEAYEKSAREYDQAHNDIKEVKRTIDFFIKNLKGKKILDVGCGPGRDSKYFTEKKLTVTGIDLTNKFLKIAANKSRMAQFIKMDMRKLTFKRASFDGIWASASFLHLPKKDAKKTIVGFKKVLKPNGIIYLDVEKGSEEKIIRKVEYKQKERLISFYKKDEILALIKRTGLTVFKVIIQRDKYGWIKIFARKNN
jgi:ubiquinone/menaquinone biosynthesis C-methylase UbiE